MQLGPRCDAYDWGYSGKDVTKPKSRDAGGSSGAADAQPAVSTAPWATAAYTGIWCGAWGTSLTAADAATFAGKDFTFAGGNGGPTSPLPMCTSTPGPKNFCYRRAVVKCGGGGGGCLPGCSCGLQ